MKHNNLHPKQVSAQDLGGQNTKGIHWCETKGESFTHFRLSSYIHVPIEKRTKFEPSNRKGLFVGYSETSKAYRVFIPDQSKTVVSRDVKFDGDFASWKSHEPIPRTEDEEREAPKAEPRSPTASNSRQQQP
jgi:hypothetical protein